MQTMIKAAKGKGNDAVALNGTEDNSIERKIARDAEKRKTYSLYFAAFLIILAVLIYGVSLIEPVQKKYIYPFPHQNLIQLYADANGVDTALVASVIMNESKFREDVHSHRGAVGLMQIMPDTAEWIAGRMGDDDFTIEKLHDPETNIRYGVWYLAELEREFEGNEVLALAAYNAGRGTVWDWYDERGWTMSFHALSDIPYPETRNYVKNVLKCRDKYKKLYENVK